MATDLKKTGKPAAPEEPESLDLRSMDITEEKRQELLRLFPEARTEGGKIDFDRLRLALGETIDTGRERYGMTWPGKAGCFRTIQTPSIGTLLPSRDESVHFDTTENLIIEGDNLEVLKLLQKSYLGKVKMIYIDPPYNTGNDFIYPDNYSESLQTYLEYTGQVDEEGRKFGTNTETDGRFHSKWMNMMYPRLYLARNLLRDDAFVLISIDDSEIKALRTLMDDIFGEENFVDTIVWKKRYGGGAKEKHLVTLHEYVVVYARSLAAIPNIYVPLTQKSIDRYYKHKDSNFQERGAFRTHPLESMKSFEERENLRFPIEAPDGTLVMPQRQWRWSPSRVEQARAAGELHFSRARDSSWVISSKQYLRDDGEERQTKFFSVIDDVYTQHGTNEIVELFGDAQIFPFPKPSKLVEKLVQFAAPDENDLVLDFFAGSGSTADAILHGNSIQGAKRRFVLVQLPEPTRERHVDGSWIESAAYKAGFQTIVDITKARVRKIVSRLTSDEELKLSLNGEAQQDRGFRVFKLAESNLTTWDADAPVDEQALGEQLQLHVDHIRPGRTQEDILFEILLKSGYPLTAKVETLELAGKKVFSIAEGALLVCLENALTIEVIRAIAGKKPERVVCLDAGFAGNDQLKANAVQIFKTLHRRADEPVTSSDVTVFRTV